MTEKQKNVGKTAGLIFAVIAIILFLTPMLLGFDEESFVVFYVWGLSLMIFSIILLLGSGSQKEKEDAIRKKEEEREKEMQVRRDQELIKKKEEELHIKENYKEIIDKGLEDLLFNFIRKYGTKPSAKSDIFCELLKNKYKVNLSREEIMGVLRYAEEDMKDKMEDIKLEEMERELTEGLDEFDTGELKLSQQMDEAETADWVILLAVLASLLCFIAGIWMLTIKSEASASGEGGSIFESAIHAVGLYFIAKGFFLGPALYLMGKKR